MTENIIEDITSEYQQQLLEIQKAIYNSKFLDPANPPKREEIIKSYGKGRGEMSKLYKPEGHNVSNPEVQYNISWEQYMSYLLLHGKPKNKKGTRRFDTSKERKTMVSHLISHLKHIPTTVDLEKAYPVLSDILSDDFRQVIDKDIQSLLKK